MLNFAIAYAKRHALALDSCHGDLTHTRFHHAESTGIIQLDFYRLMSDHRPKIFY